jgi:hypothetical protein
MPAINGRGKTHTPFKRQCTSGWKIAPIERTAKKAFKVNLRKDKIPLIAQWVGISMDEVQRVRTSRERWKHNIYPLILMGWSRNDCISYLEGLGVSAPKSSCIFCPYRSDAQWADLPSDELERATRLENTMRAMWEQKLGYVGRLQNVPSFHQSGVPLKDRPWEKDHPSNEKISGFNNECSGTCGV